eukprot:GFUD01004417.1.p1 GENE.GFUD01004417.1~~GFUD01004417.1.p1  ORF type:complete len:447 (-),score=104.56 GFUD01004417.1:452-1792(-)
MASRIVKSPVVQTTAKRQFAAQAAVARSERELVKAEPLKVSTLKNGLTVASIENHSPVATLGVVIKAGSRNETYDNAGISHSLRIAAGLATKNNSAFGICRNLQQVGSSMVCTQGREHTLYTVQATRDQTDIAVEYLTDVVSNQAFKPWELERSSPRMKLELASRSPATQAVELLHQAAFRSGLGNSLYAAPNKVGSHGTAQLSQFVSKHFTTNRAALLGIGVSHSALTKFADLLHLDTGAGPAGTASKYSGGELRVETGGGLAYVALAADTAGVVNVADCMAALLLQRVLGMGANVKYGTGQGKLAQAAGAASGNAAASAICQMYSDAGLLGAMVVAEAASAGKVVEAVAAALRSATVTDEEVAAAKKKMLADVYTLLEDPVQQVENMGAQLLVSGDVMPTAQLPELIGGLTTADVQAAAKKLSSAKLSMGAVGNLSTVPFLDSL